MLKLFFKSSLFIFLSKPIIIVMGRPSYTLQNIFKTRTIYLDLLFPYCLIIWYPKFRISGPRVEFKGISTFLYFYIRILPGLSYSSSTGGWVVYNVYVWYHVPFQVFLIYFQLFLWISPRDLRSCKLPIQHCIQGVTQIWEIPIFLSLYMLVLGT